MIPEQITRAGRAVEERMRELHLNTAKLAEMSGVSTRAIRALLHGERWPHLSTRAEVEKALGWRPGELSRRAVGSRTTDAIAEMTVAELVELMSALTAELRRRVGPAGGDRREPTFE